jgi:LysM repeat protein
MDVRKGLLMIAVAAALVAALAPSTPALAWSNCPRYVTVQWGDTLTGIAATCGTTVAAIQAANPGLGWWLYAGQVLVIPDGYASIPAYTGSAPGGTYVVQRGDTLGNIAARYGVALRDLLAVNPQIWYPDLIYPGQVIGLPGYASCCTYVPTPAPVYYPPSYPAQPYYPPPAYGVSDHGWLTVTYSKGLLVRTGPGLGYAEIVSPLVGALKDTRWQYRKSSLTTDSIQFVWVEVTLAPGVPGYTTGWILARDGQGKYFTDPHLGPPLDSAHRGPTARIKEPPSSGGSSFA